MCFKLEYCDKIIYKYELSRNMNWIVGGALAW